jgi:Leucine-rich repeat (LRR) protein
MNGDPGFVQCGVNARGWTKVHKDQFPDTLKYLKLDTTSINVFENDSFSGKEILILEITGHVIDSFQSEAFRGLRNLQVLIIRSNEWRVNPDAEHHFFYAFRHNENMTELILEQNSVTLSDVDAEHTTNDTVLEKLAYLSLGGNDLQRIESFFFTPLRNSPIKDLNLKNCNLRAMGEDAFSCLQHLEHVDFFGNPGIMVPSLTHSPLHKALGKSDVCSLGLGQTNLVTVPKLTTIAVNNTLRRLNLSGNLYPILGIMFSFDMDALTDLILQDCKITDIAKNTLAQLPNLSYLDVSNNKITRMLDELLLTSLHTLDVSFQTGDRNGKFLIYPDTFNRTDMTQLRVLKLSGNRLYYTENQVERTSLCNTSFHGLTSLEELYIDHSSITGIEDGFFNNLPSLRVLNLSYVNELEGLRGSTFVGANKMEVMDLSYSSRTFSHLTGNEELGEALGNPQLRELYLACALSIDCKRHTNYSDPISEVVMKGLPNIEILDISNNDLAMWNGDPFWNNTKLKYLNVASNAIVIITDGMMTTFRRLELLDMRSNPVVCNRQVVKFFHMAQDMEAEGKEIVGWEGGEGYFCVRQGQLMHPISYKAYEEEFMRKQIMAIVVVSVTLVALLCSTSYYVYQNRFFIGYYLARRRRGLSERRDPEQEYTYDVFVSYSNDQRHWVKEELLPRLEQETPHLRACVHERDFQVGVSVTENIVECLDRSRRFLVVLTPGFASSKWCMFELHLAQTRMFDGEKNNGLIVVIREKVDEKSINRVLKYVLRTWTYLRWPATAAFEGDVAKLDEFFTRLKHSILKGASKGSIKHADTEEAL